ncbi:unnamed protein product [Ranitomeya imitator]|uniref:SRCR domain-containing protein n=1 Tax=Ranitomeya imitator TaxID=111125 RepID=A0ABN9KVE1_9NEOB|nr:unnamed protein product [Ranitomeya imitator]
MLRLMAPKEFTLPEAAVRLVGPDVCEGRVEIFYGNAWGTVCAGMWDLLDGDVVCKQLNCGTAIEISTNGKYGQGPPYSGLTYFQCTGIEKDLLACPFTVLPHSHIYLSDSGVKCTGIQKIWKVQMSVESHTALEGLNNTLLEKAAHTFTGDHMPQELDFLFEQMTLLGLYLQSLLLKLLQHQPKSSKMLLKREVYDDVIQAVALEPPENLTQLLQMIFK